MKQQPGMFESRVNLCCVVVGCLLRSVAVRLNMCYKLVRNTTFLQNTSVVLKIKLTPNPFDGPRHRKFGCPTQLLNNKSLFCSLFHISMIWHGVFPHPSYMYRIASTSPEISRTSPLPHFETFGL
jgi:hypothetical protein